MKVQSVPVLGRKCTDGYGIRYYLKKVGRSVFQKSSSSVFGPGSFCTADPVASTIITDIMTPIKVTSDQNICKLALFDFIRHF